RTRVILSSGRILLKGPPKTSALWTPLVLRSSIIVVAGAIRFRSVKSIENRNDRRVHRDGTILRAPAIRLLHPDQGNPWISKLVCEEAGSGGASTEIYRFLAGAACCSHHSVRLLLLARGTDGVDVGRSRRPLGPGRLYSHYPYRSIRHQPCRLVGKG